MFEGLAAQRLLALFTLGWLLLNFPLLALWDRDVSVFGVPLLPAALFVGWALLDRALAWIVERSHGRRNGAMLSAPLVIGASFAYLLLLFGVAHFGRPAGAAGAAR